MVTGSCTDELKLNVSVDKIWKAAACEIYKLLPKLLPEIIASAEATGDGGAGSIRTHHYTPEIAAVKGCSLTKEKIEVLDHANYLAKYKVIEGGHFGKLKSKAGELKFEAVGVDSCVVKFKLQYDSIDENYSATEEDVAALKQPIVTPLKAVAAYLLANPDAYT